MSTVNLSKADVRRALVRHHFTPCATQEEAFERLRSIQFDPIAPVGCNHDLVLQARVKGYKIGDWQDTAYKKRHIYDGWDKMASLVLFAGWPLRRYISEVGRRGYDKKIFEDHKDAVEIILKELAEHGPMQPKDFEFQQRREEWKGSWHGPSVTKQTLRALWHAGLIMTSGRKSGQHLYDLTERIVPQRLRDMPLLDPKDAVRELVLERHRAMGMVRPSAPPEVWSYTVLMYDKRDAIAELVKRGEIIPVDVEGMKAHATPEFLALLDQPSMKPRAVFIAPLDQFIWDRKMTAHLFGFDYIWEIYTPLAKRKWGYYVMPVLFGDELVARVEFWNRGGILEIREWHLENSQPPKAFWPALQKALQEFMKYASAKEIRIQDHIDPSFRENLGSNLPFWES
ncbi:MAG TPA: crosslink repair DNA glycosylase YcaQ family protein [Fimbriimonadaceae bacterium]